MAWEEGDPTEQDESWISARVSGDLRKRLDRLVRVHDFDTLSDLLRRILVEAASQLEEGIHPQFDVSARDDESEEE